MNLARESFNGSADEKQISYAALTCTSVNLLGDVLKRASVGINTDEKLVWILTRQVVNEESIASTNVDNHSVAGGVNSCFKFGSGELSDCAAANNVYHFGNPQIKVLENDYWLQPHDGEQLN